MFQLLISFMLACTLMSPSLFAGCTESTCCQSADIEIGWRRDDLKWKNTHLESSYVHARANDHLHFKDIESYTISGQVKWVSSDYYVRFSADYGATQKGRAHEHFNIHSRYLYYPIGVFTSDRIKRRSEVYDFDGAVGYPFAFFSCRLSVIPLIGFSYHRQHLRVKHNEESNDSQSSSESSSEFFDSHSSSAFYISSSNPFRDSPSSNPFGSPSNSSIASELGLSNPHHTSMYRFTWYGFYLGADIAYALDSCWTLFWDTEFHFYDNCHRKRKSWTGVYFVDDYHKKGHAYGFNNTIGATYYIANCWYTTLSVDFNWWKADSKHDMLRWKMVAAKIGFAYAF